VQGGETRVGEKLGEGRRLPVEALVLDAEAGTGQGGGNAAARHVLHHARREHPHPLAVESCRQRVRGGIVEEQEPAFAQLPARQRQAIREIGEIGDRAEKNDCID